VPAATKYGTLSCQCAATASKIMFAFPLPYKLQNYHIDMFCMGTGEQDLLGAYKRLAAWPVERVGWAGQSRHRGVAAAHAGRLHLED
jgi:hypothetical protein